MGRWQSQTHTASLSHSLSTRSPTLPEKPPRFVMDICITCPVCHLREQDTLGLPHGFDGQVHPLVILSETLGKENALPQ